MTLHQLSATLKNSAREKLSGKYSNAILLDILHYFSIFAALFVFLVPVLFICLFISIFSGTTELGGGYVLTLSISMMLITSFLGIMNTGVSLFFLNLACGRTASVSDLFYGYRYLFKKSLAISTTMVLVSSIPMIPHDICYYMFETVGSTQWALLTILFYIIGTMISLPISLALSQSFFLLLDFPRYSAKQILALSVRMMKGRKWKLLYIQLSFYPLLLLSTLTFGIGNLWITPYMNLTQTLFFLEIMKPTAAQEV